MKTNNIIKQLYLIGNDILSDQSLKNYLNFGTGGYVPYFLIPKTEFAFIQTLNILKKYGINFKILGNGTNIIAADKKFDFWIISTQYLNNIEFILTNQIYIQAGTNLSASIYYLAEKGLGGWESLAGIPGSVGGAIYMNAGAYDGQIKDFIEKVKVLDLKNNKLYFLKTQECKFGYRSSIFQQKKHLVILGAIFKLKSNYPEKILEKIQLYNTKRWEKQPITQHSAGSIFKRPKPDFYVGTTIEKLGLKGYKIGNIQISNKHAGFVVNLGNGKFEDAYKLINLIKKLVKEKYGQDLETEPEIWM